MKRRWAHGLGALCGAALLACSTGKQTLGRETTTDEHLPWAGGSGYFARWAHGPPSSSSFIPLMVWLQNPDNASRFAEVGVNSYMGLWQGPTEEQLSTLESSKMPAVCEQSGVWQDHLGDSPIQGWMQVDQPDDAQVKDDGSYGPCIDPSAMARRYASMREKDPTRPVFMNLGRGVVDGEWVGRGSCAGHDEMYPAYARAADVLTFIAYPVNAGLPLESIAQGIDKLADYSNHEKLVLAAIEASRIDGDVGPTPEQIDAEVWMALIHGAAGVLYYCHQLQPSVNETACLDDPASHDALVAINALVTSLAPVLNTAPIANAVSVAAEPIVLIDTMVKRDATHTYVFAVSMGDTGTTVHFELSGSTLTGTAEVIGEGRTVSVHDGAFDDDFPSRRRHLYRIAR
jgi:hypothetical protein